MYYLTIHCSLALFILFSFTTACSCVTLGCLMLTIILLEVAQRPPQLI